MGRRRACASHNKFILGLCWRVGLVSAACVRLMKGAGGQRVACAAVLPRMIIPGAPRAVAAALVSRKFSRAGLRRLLARVRARGGGGSRGSAPHTRVAEM